MPSNANLRRQRFLGGVIGVILLGAALVFHFFPRVFHVDAIPSAQGARAMPVVPGSKAQPEHVPSDAELNAGPPLTLAPTAVIVARNHRQADLPQQMSADTPKVQQLLTQAKKAVRAGKLTGDDRSAGALYAQALKLKPDSRAAAQGLFDVRARLVAEADQEVAAGDADSAAESLVGLRSLPNAVQESKRLQEKLDTLAVVRPMLTQAATLLASGHADRPSGSNALEVYRAVQALDPQNAVAEQGIFQVQRAVLARALTAVAQNQFTDADKALAEAQAIHPDSQQMQDVRRRVDDMRSQRAGGLLDQAGSALDAGNVALASKLAAQAKTVEPGYKPLAAFDEKLVNARLYASYKPGQVFNDRYTDLPGKTPTMVVIPTGTFQMGAPDNKNDSHSTEVPRHQVNISKGFAMARSEVTVAEFGDFVRASGYVPDSLKLSGASVYDERSGTMRDDTQASWKDDYTGHKAGLNLPVVNISWNDARAYAGWLAKHTGKPYRLASEAEFAYALRAGTSTLYWWGNGTPSRPVENLTGSGDRSHRGRRWNHAFANYKDGFWGPAPVMSFVANPFGLYDMDGNVSEWVADCWHDSYLRAPNNGSAWLNPGCSAHVVRGGSWGSSPEQVIYSYRQGVEGDVRSGRVGFRVVREL